MNERIKELAKVAVQYTNDTVAHLERVHNRDFSFDEIDEVYDTKFAELIVKECAVIFKKNWTMAGSEPPISAVKTHFGVEE